MRNVCACGPMVKACGLLALGVLLGLSLQPRPAESNVTAQGKATPGGAEERLRQLKIDLPPVTKPTNTYVNAVRVGDMLYVSGTGPGKVTGRLGQDYDVAKGKAA